MKVRGVRVSLEEVEVVACRAAGLPTGSFAVVFDPVTDALRDGKGNCLSADSPPAAIASASPDRGRLLGFFESNQAQVRKRGDGLAKLRLQLAEMLTPAQLPAVLVPVVGGFPFTTSGKVSLYEGPHLLWLRDARTVPSSNSLDISSIFYSVYKTEFRIVLDEQCFHAVIFPHVRVRPTG